MWIANMASKVNNLLYVHTNSAIHLTDLRHWLQKCNYLSANFFQLHSNTCPCSLCNTVKIHLIFITSCSSKHTTLLLQLLIHFCLTCQLFFPNTSTLGRVSQSWTFGDCLIRIFYRPDILPAYEPTSKHWAHTCCFMCVLTCHFLGEPVLSQRRLTGTTAYFTSWMSFLPFNV